MKNVGRIGIIVMEGEVVVVHQFSDDVVIHVEILNVLLFINDKS